MLALLPVERVHSTPVEPGVQRGPQLGLAPEPVGKRDLVDVDVKAVPELLSALSWLSSRRPYSR